jgi:hypothetical protein
MYDTTTRWITVQDTYFWTTSITGVKIGTSEYALAATEDIIFDTGTSIGYIPKKEGNAIMKKLLKGIKHIKFGGRWYTSCDTSLFSSVYLLLGTYWIEISPTTFVMSHSATKTSGSYSCVLGFAT